MAYVTVPKDLTHVKSKVLFGLTKRQLVCFGGALLTGGPLYFLTRDYLSNSAAALLMIFAMLPGLLFALFERHGQPLEVVIQQMIQCCFIRPKERPYQTNNAYAALPVSKSSYSSTNLINKFEGVNLLPYSFSNFLKDSKIFFKPISFA